MRRKPITAILGLFCIAVAASLPAVEKVADDGFSEYTAVYALRRGSLKAGETTYTLQRNPDGTYLYKSVSQPTGLVALFRNDVIKEDVRFEIENDQLRPIHYEYKHENTNKNRDQSISFDWKAKTAQLNNRGNHSEHALNRYTIDRASMPLAIGYALENDKLPRRYRLLDHGKVKNYHMVVESGKPIKTKAGRFSTVLVKRKLNHKDQQLRIWLAPEHDYLPIRIENEDPGGEVTSLELLRVEYAGAQSD